MDVSTGEGGGGGIFVGEGVRELGGVVVGVCVGADVGEGMRVPVIPGARVGAVLVPFCGLNLASGITGMAAGGSFWVLVVWSSHTTPWAEMSLNPFGRDRRGCRRSNSICDRCVRANVVT